MRVRLIALVLLASVASPALAQSDRIDRRVQRLEEDMRAVQRKVFPAGPELQPEIGAQPNVVTLPGDAASGALADLTARVDALEGQLARLTGQSEENSNRLNQLESALADLRAAAQRQAEQMAAPIPVEAPPPATTTNARDALPGADAAASPPVAGDPGEAAYNAGYRLWEAKDYAGAQAALNAMAKKYPKHRFASWARNLEGRAYLDEGKPATAAKVLLANYQTDPKGERAADSLYFLGQSLMRLKRGPEACQVYDELEEVYGSTLRDYLRQRLPAARKEAKCG